MVPETCIHYLIDWKKNLIDDFILISYENENETNCLQTVDNLGFLQFTFKKVDPIWKYFTRIQLSKIQAYLGDVPEKSTRGKAIQAFKTGQVYGYSSLGLLVLVCGGCGVWRNSRIVGTAPVDSGNIDYTNVKVRGFPLRVILSMGMTNSKHVSPHVSITLTNYCTFI